MSCCGSALYLNGIGAEIFLGKCSCNGILSGLCAGRSAGYSVYCGILLIGGAALLADSYTVAGSIVRTPEGLGLSPAMRNDLALYGLGLFLKALLGKCSCIGNC